METRKSAVCVKVWWDFRRCLGEGRAMGLCNTSALDDVRCQTCFETLKFSLLKENHEKTYPNSFMRGNLSSWGPNYDWNDMPGHALLPTDKTRSTAAGACAGASLWQVRSSSVRESSDYIVGSGFQLWPGNHVPGSILQGESGWVLPSPSTNLTEIFEFS